MLASRRGEAELSHPWSLKLDTAAYPPQLLPLPSPSPLSTATGTAASHRKPSSSSPLLLAAGSPRMSNTGFETPLSNATEWTGQYSFLPPTEPIFAAPAYDHVSGGGSGSGSGSGGSGGVGDVAGRSGDDGSRHDGSGGVGVGAGEGGHGSSGGGDGGSNMGQAQARPSTGTQGGSSKDDGLGSLYHSHRHSIDPLGLRQPSQGQSQVKSQQQSQQQQQQHQQHQQHQHQQQQQQQQQLQHQQMPGIKAPPTPTGSDLHGHMALSGTLSSLSSVLQMPDGTTGHVGGSSGSGSGSGGSGGSGSGSGSGSTNTGGGPGGEDTSGLKDDDEDLLDDEEMGDTTGEAEGITAPAQTAAERTAQRRKMKRFRLTHQQTRFLMSEFAKQPHPDAAHRERLSREIPGLSPRQVQVWFQNRRAKIKRLAADDRERMIKMRAVPDDFDNVQALHSPYGAVHGLGTPMASPVDFAAAAAAAAASYTDHMMRPLMVDVRRPDGDDHLSPTGLSPAFGSIGFNPAASLNNPDMLSPLSPTSAGGGDHGHAHPHQHHHHAPHAGSGSAASPLHAHSPHHHHAAGRYASYSAGGSGGALSPLSGPRTSNPYMRPGGGGLDGTMGVGVGVGIGVGVGGSASSNSAPSNSSVATAASSTANTSPGHAQRHHIRPLQPLQLRETMSRSRSDNLQSPLRSSMSWKGDALDYSSYQGGSASPQLAGRSSQAPGHGHGHGQGLYGSDSSTATTLGYDASGYSGSTVQSPTHMAYPAFQSPTLQPPTSQSRPTRLRAASATLPLALDLRTTSAAVSASGPGSGSPTAAASMAMSRPGLSSLSSMSSMTSMPSMPSMSSMSSMTSMSSMSSMSPLSSSSPHHHQQHPMGSLNGLVSSSYSASFPTSAPLTAPLDFGLAASSSRIAATSAGSSAPTAIAGLGYRSATDYAMPQMSAPLEPPSDFSQAFSSMANGTTTGNSSSTGNGNGSNSNTSGNSNNTNHTNIIGSNGRNTAASPYGTGFLAGGSGGAPHHSPTPGADVDGGGHGDSSLKRKLSFSSASTNAAAASLYGSTVL